MNESCCYDNPSTEIASKEVDIKWDSKPPNTLREDREESSSSREDQDDEEGRDPGTKMATVLISGFIEVTHNLCCISRVEVHVRGIESHDGFGMVKGKRQAGQLRC